MDRPMAHGRRRLLRTAERALSPSSSFFFVFVSPNAGQRLAVGTVLADPKLRVGTDKSGVDAVKNRLWSRFSVMCIRLCAYMEQAALIVAS